MFFVTQRLALADFSSDACRQCVVEVFGRFVASEVLYVFYKIIVKKLHFLALSLRMPTVPKNTTQHTLGCSPPLSSPWRVERSYFRCVNALLGCEIETWGISAISRNVSITREQDIFKLKHLDCFIPEAVPFIWNHWQIYTVTLELWTQLTVSASDVQKYTRSLFRTHIQWR